MSITLDNERVGKKYSSSNKMTDVLLPDMKTNLTQDLREKNKEEEEVA